MKKTASGNYFRKCSHGKTAVVVIAVLLFVFQAAEARIGIMGAMDEEIGSLKKDMTVVKTETTGNRTFYVGKCKGKDIVLVRSEIGKVNAAVTADILIREFKVDRIIFTGVAGAVDAKLQPGDILIATQLVQHDYGKLKGDAFTPWMLNMPEADGTTKKVFQFDTDPELVKLAFETAKRTKFKQINITLPGYKKRAPGVFKGIVATGDQFVASARKREWLAGQFNASAVEMEGAAVAQVCATYGVPFLVVRAMSDRADEVAEDTFNMVKDTAAENSALLVENMLKGMKPDGAKAGK